MKLSMLALPVLLVSTLAAVGCAEPSADDATTESNIEAVTQKVDSIAACSGRDLCVKKVVLKALLSSDLEVTNAFAGEDPTKNAGEYFISWMQAGNGTYSTFGIETKPLGGGKYTVRLGLGNADLGEGGTESGCHFEFTIDHDTIVEKEISAFCAG